MEIEFTRTEGGTRWIYRLTEGPQGSTGPWTGEITKWSPGAPAPEKEALTLIPDTEGSHGQGREAVRSWKTEDGWTQWTIGPDGGQSIALTETRNGKYQWSAGVGD